RLRRRRGELTFIAVAVPAPLELEDLGTTRERARQAHRAEGRFAARGLKANRRVVPMRLPPAGHGIDELLGQLDDRLVQREVRGAERYLPLDGLDDGGVRVTEDHRAAAEQIVDVFLAVGVPQPRAP